MSELTRGPSLSGVARNRRYMLYLAVANVSSFGYSVYAVSIVWFSYHLAGGIVTSGAVLGVEYAAYTLTFLFGPLVDRARDKRLLFLATFPVQAALVGLLAFQGRAGPVQTWELLSVVAAVSLLWDIAWATFNVVPRLLLTKDEMFAAGGVSGLVASANTLGGYALGGVAIVVVGPYGGLAFYAIALAAASVLAAVVRIPAAVRGLPGFWSSMKEGWSLVLVKDRATLGGIALADVARGAFFAAPTLLMVLVAVDEFPSSAVAFASFFVAYVLGSTLADLILGKLNPRSSVGLIMLSSIGTLALGILAIAATPSSLAAFLLLWLMLGLATESYVAARFTYVRAQVPPELQGRVSANLYLFQGVPSAIGAVWIASVASRAPLSATCVLVALGFALCFVVLVAQPRVRRLAF